MKNFANRRRFLAAGSAVAVYTTCARTLCAAEIRNFEVCIAVADNGEATNRIVESMRKRFPSASLLTDVLTNPLRKKATIYVAVGPAAFRSLLAKNLVGLVVSTFTSSQAYTAILDRSPKSHSLAVTAIYAEPSPIHQIQLISHLYKKRVSVAVLISDKTSYLLPVFSRLNLGEGITLSVERVGAGDDINHVLKRVDQASVILAIPDSSIFNTENIRNILITTYRRNQSVVGFSTPLVKAGAIASAVSDIDDIVVQIGEFIDEYSASGHIPEPQFPKYFDVVINDSVARSLNLVVDDSVRKLSRKPSGLKR